ncbi:MAG TPA: PaaI family thioesterase [Candidatus Acidoferrales bacterium]|nr:PaaI family thioesterase [Candidatus Acidoferrales bacterium]
MRYRKLTVRETNEVLRTIPFNRLLGMRVLRMHRDGITIECKVGSRLLNSARIVHGGVSAAMADAAVGIAIHRHTGDRRPITTVEMKINYFRPVKEGRILARSHLLRVGSTICVGRVDITDGQARAIGTALVTYMLVGPRGSASA